MTDKTLIDFNVNDAVLVKLTELGLEELKKQNIDPPETDEDGYSRWQLWVLMGCFGHRMMNGSKLMFETNIKFEVETLRNKPRFDGEKCHIGCAYLGKQHPPKCWSYTGAFGDGRLEFEDVPERVSFFRCSDCIEEFGLEDPNAKNKEHK
jgi:hypothetical protein